MCNRVIWVVSIDTGSYGMPPLISQMFSILGLFAGDISFSQPGCAGLTDFPTVLAVNVFGTS